jgi:tetratricopeptide (TPR) repeat protein
MANMINVVQITAKQVFYSARRAVIAGDFLSAYKLIVVLKLFRTTSIDTTEVVKELLKGFINKPQFSHELSEPPGYIIELMSGLFSNGHCQERDELGQVIFKQYPDIVNVLNSQAAALLNLEKFTEAIKIYHMIIALFPEESITYNNLGVAHHQQGNDLEAVKNYNLAIRFNSDYIAAYHNRGIALYDLGEKELARKSYHQAIDLDPLHVDSHMNLANVYASIHCYDSAISVLNTVIKLRPDHYRAYYNLANIFKIIGNNELAKFNYAKCIENNRQSYLAYCNKGGILEAEGYLNDARDCYSHSIKVNPEFLQGYYNFSQLHFFKKNDSTLALMDRLYHRYQNKDDAFVCLLFALAKAYADLGLYDDSFNYLSEANGLRKKILGYTFEDSKKLFDWITTIFSNAIQNDCSLLFRDHRQYIFIVGMPRSGTSLVEQIIASHTGVYGAGELMLLQDGIFEVMEEIKKHGMNEHHFKLIKDNYEAGIDKMGIQENIIIDKLPLNFIYIGFIMNIFPNAKIIHLTRDPMAVCWSNFKHYFVSKGNQFAYDLVDTAEFYKYYTDLMLFWHKRFIGKIYDLSYEELTENQEQETRKLLEYCGLPWENACLEFYKTKRVVNTASATQVRQKMYTGSSQAWRKYKKHLQPLLDRLRIYGLTAE